MPARPSIADLARDREEAASQLEAAIADLGAKYAALRRTTSALEFKVNVELARGLEIAIVLHLARAGLGELLERKLVGTPASLRALVEQQHARTATIGGAA